MFQSSTNAWLLSSTNASNRVVNQLHMNAILDTFLPLAAAVNERHSTRHTFLMLTVRTFPKTAEFVLESFIRSLHELPPVAKQRPIDNRRSRTRKRSGIVALRLQFCHFGYMNVRRRARDA